MENELRDFKEASTRGFEDNVEQKHAAEYVIDQLVGEYGTSGVSNHIDRVGGDIKKDKRLRVIIYSIVMGLTMAVLTYFGIKAYFSKYVYDSAVGYSERGQSYLEAEMTKGLTHDEKLILLGDPSQTSEGARYKALWDIDRDNPSYYIEYAMGSTRDSGVLPADFVEQGAQIDPGNGWYQLIAAGFEAEGIVIKSSSMSSSPARGGRSRRGSRIPSGSPSEGSKIPESTKPSVVPVTKPVPKWHVTDEAKFKKALELLYLAAGSERLESHHKDLIVKRLSLLPQSGFDYTSRLGPIVYIAGQPVHGMNMSYLVKVIRAEAERCGIERDADRLKKLIEAWTVIGQRNTKDGWSLVDALLVKAWAWAPLEDFRDAAIACKMDEEAKEFDRLHTWSKADKAAKKMRSTSQDDYDHKYGVLHRMTLPLIERQVENGPRIQLENLKSGRMTDHAFAARVLSAFASILLLLVSGLVSLYAFRHRPVIRKLAIAHRSKLFLHDWLWIIGIGVILPIILYLVVNLLSPWSARDLGVHVVGFYTVSAQFGCMVYLMIILVPVVANWRWSRSAQYFGFKSGWIQWVPVILLVVAMPLSGVGDMLWGSINEVIRISAALLGGALLWLMIRVVRALFSGNQQAVARVLIAHTILPVYLIAALIMASMIPVFYQEEKKWVAKEELMVISPDEPGFSSIEYRVSEQIKAELRQTMGWTE